MYIYIERVFYLQQIKGACCLPPINNFNSNGDVNVVGENMQILKVLMLETRCFYLRSYVVYHIYFDR